MSAFLRRVDSPGWCVALTLAAYTLFAAILLDHSHWNPSVFVTAGTNNANLAEIPYQFHLLVDSDGYDGQFFYRLARNPLTAKAVDYGIRLDNPSYRQQRIFYPVLAWMFSAGGGPALPWVLIAINLAGLAAVAWLAARLARAAGRHHLYGLAIAFSPALLLCLARDLSEITALALLLAGLYCAANRRRALTALFLVLAVLTRETTLVPAAAGLVLCLLRPGQAPPLRREDAWVFALPCAVYVLMQLVLLHRWGIAPVVNGGGNLGMPFYGLLLSLQHVVATSSGWVQALYAAEIGMLCLALAGGLGCLLRADSAPLLRLSWALYSVLFMLLSYGVWVEDWSFLRASMEWYALAGVLLVQTRSPLLAAYALAGPLVTLAIAARLVIVGC